MTKAHERIAIIAMLFSGLVLFAAMPVWHWPVAALSPPDYTVTPEDFLAKLANQQADEQGVVRPPPGDVYVAARQWDFQPSLALEAGKTYRLHLTSLDAIHGFRLNGHDLLLTPGRAQILTFTPDAPGRLPIQCSEFCGSGHNRMTAWIDVTQP